MRLLYLSCHSVHEVDDALMFRDCGIDMFTKGAFDNNTRTTVPKCTDGTSDFLTDDEIHKLRHGNPRKLSPEIVSKFDIVYSLAVPDWPIENWEVIKDKICILRLNGQSDTYTAERLSPYVDEGLKLIGYSPHENKRFACTSIYRTIRFHKDESEFKGWVGNIKKVLTVNQSIRRGDSIHQTCNHDAYEAVTKDLPRALVGQDNDGIGDFWLGHLDYELLKHVYRTHGAYFYTGTKPASYVFNFIEAWMTGIPIVALGDKFNTGEVPSLIDDGINGFVSNDIEELQYKLKLLLEDRDLAKKIGEAGRKKAISLFSVKLIQPQWQQLFKDIENEHMG